MSEHQSLFPAPEEIEQLTKELVSRNSITLSKDGPGDFNESSFAVFLKEWFDNHNVCSVLQNLPDGRKNVFAYVGGTSEKTVILSGHFDTVSVDAYLQAGLHPFDADRLAKEQLVDSAKFIPGRGALDMKSGIATAMQLMKFWNAEKTNLPGSVLFVATCDEENNSYGILNALDVLLALKGKATDSEYTRIAHAISNGKTLQYSGVINVDYTTERFDGDAHYHVWNGTVGKVLLCAYVQGKQTHVGEPFAGLHAGVLLARIVSAIDGNMEIAGATVPPTLLKLGDDRREYNVMTPRSASAYVNICTVGRQPVEILKKITTIVQNTIQTFQEYNKQRYESYCRLMHIPAKRNDTEVRLIYYSELLRLALDQTGKTEVDRLVASALETQPGCDDREKSFAIVDTLVSRIMPHQPVVVLFYAPPFYPYIRPDGERLAGVMKNAVKEIGTKHKIEIEVNDYYPYISDMSYLRLEPEIAGIVAEMINEYPVWGKSYDLPFKKISELQLPVVNIGPHGYGAHQISERVERFYSMRVLPELLDRTVMEVLNL